MRGAESVSLVTFLLVVQLIVVLLRADGVSITPAIITAIILICMSSVLLADTKSRRWFAYGDSFALGGSLAGDLAFIFGLVGAIVYAKRYTNAAIASGVAAFFGIVVAIACSTWTSQILLLTDEYPSQAEVDSLYIMMEKLHYVTSKLGIPYFIICGALIGACRHGGMMQWDDDIDVGMLSKDIDRLYAHKAELAAEGLTLGPRNETNCLKVYYKKGGKTAFIDIFEYDIKDDMYFYKDPVARKKYPKEAYMSKEIIEPLRDDYVYGPLRLKGPADGVRFIKQAYGDSVMTHYKIQSPHTNRSLLLKKVASATRNDGLKALDAQSLQPRVPSFFLEQRTT